MKIMTVTDLGEETPLILGKKIRNQASKTTPPPSLSSKFGFATVHSTGISTPKERDCFQFILEGNVTLTLIIGDSPIRYYPVS